MPLSPRPCYKRCTASVTAWWHHRLLTTRSLRGRLRLSLFLASAGIALLLGGSAIAIDETLEHAVLQNTLRAESGKFSALAMQSRPIAGDLPKRYYGGGGNDEDFDLSYDKKAGVHQRRLASGLLCDGDDQCGLPAWLGAGALARLKPDLNASNPLALEAGALQRPTDNFTQRLTDRLTGFYHGDAQKRSTVPPAFRRLGVGFHEAVGYHGRAYYVMVQQRAGGLMYLAYDTTHLRQRLRWFTALTLVAMLILMLVADQVGKRLAGYLSRPLESLATQVRGINPHARGQHLREDQGDQALDGIAQAFNDYLNQMDAYVRREQAFTRMASHELRTPQAVIASAVQLMRLQQPADNAGSAPMGRIERALSQMRETTDALLMLARNRPRDGQEGRCRVDRLLPEVAASHRLLIGAKTVEIVIDTAEACTVEAADRLVAILLANLVRNAVEHTERGRVVLSTDSGSLSVTDTGDGIDPARMAELNRAGAGDDLVFDSGLGLYIVGQICRRYGWRVSFSNNPEGGTTVRIDFA